MTQALKMTRLDFFTMKPIIKSYLIMLVIPVGMAFMDSSAMLAGMTCAWVMALTASSIFSLEEKNDLSRLYGTLSIKPTHIVAGRYLFVLFALVVVMAIVMPLSAVVSTFAHGADYLPDYLESLLPGIVFGITAFSITVGMQFPFFFAMGYTAARYWSLLPFLAMMLLVFVPGLIGGPEGGIADWFLQNPGLLMPLGLAASAVVLAGSVAVSLGLYRARRRR